MTGSVSFNEPAQWNKVKIFWNFCFLFFNQRPARRSDAIIEMKRRGWTSTRTTVDGQANDWWVSTSFVSFFVCVVGCCDYRDSFALIGPCSCASPLPVTSVTLSQLTPVLPSTEWCIPSFLSFVSVSVQCDEESCWTFVKSQRNVNIS